MTTGPTLVPLSTSPHVSAAACPLLRWAGGKQRFARRLATMLAPYVKRRVYVEPFLGGGSVFFALRPSRSILADANPDIAKLYQCIVSQPEAVAKHLAILSEMNCESDYYTIRAQYNQSPWSSLKAARLIYLNRTSFNGIYRVNASGAYNVPYGWKEDATFPTAAHLRLAAVALEGADIVHGCFRDVLPTVPSQSIVYLDPPYPADNQTAFFSHYTTDRFGEDDHHDLADLVAELHARGVLFVMSNRDTMMIRSLYSDYNVMDVPVTHNVSCKSNKRKARDLLIWNFHE